MEDNISPMEPSVAEIKSEPVEIKEPPITDVVIDEKDIEVKEKGTDGEQKNENEAEAPTSCMEKVKTSKYRNAIIGGAVGLVLLIIIIAAAAVMIGGSGGSGATVSDGQSVIQTCDVDSQILSVNKKYLKLNAVAETKVLPVIVVGNFEGPNGTVTEKDTIGDFMLVHGQYNGKWDYQLEIYLDKDIEVERSNITNAAGASYPCFKVTKINTPSEKWAAVPTLMAYKFTKATGVYTYASGAFKLKQQISASDISTTGWVTLDGTEIYSNQKKTWPSSLLCFVEGTEAPSSYDSKDDAVYEPIYNTKGSFEMNIMYTKYALPAGSAPRTAAGWGHTPTDQQNTYGDNKHFHQVGKTDDGGILVAWEDQTSGAGFITTLKEFTQKSVELPIDKGSKLGCAIAGDAGELFYVTFQTNTKKDDKKGSVAVNLYRAKTDGTTITKNQIDSSKEGASVYSWEPNDSCALIYEPTKPFLAMHYSRTNQMSRDGLNHQSAGLLFFDPTTLKISEPKNYRQTGSHSFGANVYLTSDNTITGMELGDMYPRGVTLWKANSTATKWDEKYVANTVYKVKTKHMTESNIYGKDNPLYEEISTGDTKFYQWSNDNQVYSELGAKGFIEFEDSYAVFFLSESPALDNSQAITNLNAPRNVGFVKVSKDLKTILSTGPKESGGFYNFGGKWADVSHEGIQWLTKFESKAYSLSKLKTMKVGTSGKYVLLLFEVWDSSKPHDDDKFRYTAYKVVDKDGKDYGNGHIKALCYEGMRLMRNDDPIQISNSEIILVQGADDGKLSTFKITLTGLD